MKKLKIVNVKPRIPTELKDIWKIAYNYYWAWSLEMFQLFQRMEPDQWEVAGHNPVKLLNIISEGRLEELTKNRGFIEHYQRALQDLDTYLTQKPWFDEIVKPQHSQLTIAYFCTEYGLHKSLPIYSGGLGILAADHLRSASDLGIPLVAVGLLYRYGYFHQRLTPEGWQTEEYPPTQFEYLPIQPYLGENGKQIRVSVEFPGRNVVAQVWIVNVGRVKLLLLDTDVPENLPSDRLITDQLYGGDTEHRIQQELILGVGGMRVLRTLKITPNVFHMNEGHAAFLAVERIKELMAEHHLTFEEAQTASTINNIFTTHTPVAAGHDVFSPQLASLYLDTIAKSMNLPLEQLLKLGRSNPFDTTEGFCMTVLAIRCSSYINGVSKLHGEVSRKMWAHLFGDLPLIEVPIDSVTNGVHPQTWVSPEMKMLFDRHLGSEWRERPSDAKVWERISTIGYEKIWNAKERARESLVSLVRDRIAKQIERRGASVAQIKASRQILNRDALTIGFARRFATYKRATLIFKDMERLKKILTNPKYPVQIIFAGKAHPKDHAGKELIQQIVHYVHENGLVGHIAFIEDYDISVAKKMVRGVDIWLNTPIHGQEASGTSGMKVLYNAGLNLSVLDGWWCEGYEPAVGWAIKPIEGALDPTYRDFHEANALYDILENEIVPLFYRRDNDGIPTQWIEMTKRSMSVLCPEFSTHRMLEEYLNRAYIPTSDEWLTYISNGQLKELIDRISFIRKHWHKVTFENIAVKFEPTMVTGDEIVANVKLYLGEVPPTLLQVNLFVGRLGPMDEIIETRKFELTPVSAPVGGRCEFNGKLKISWSGKIGLAVQVSPIISKVLKRLELEMAKWSEI